ncbi:MAG TPA: hydroxyethylthiazole kinase [Euzebyales bacterium]
MPPRRSSTRTGAVVVVTGATDLVVSAAGTVVIGNGHPLMARVTGLGCTASALCGAFAAVQPDPMLAAAHATAVSGIVGELAAAEAHGPGTLQLHLLDRLHDLDGTRIGTHLRVGD